MKKKTNTNKSTVTRQVDEQEHLQNNIMAVPFTGKEMRIKRLIWDPKERRVRANVQKEPLFLIRPEDMSHR